MARITVRKALADLERDGVIRRRQGVGTHLLARKRPSPKAPLPGADASGGPPKLSYFDCQEPQSER